MMAARGRRSDGDGPPESLPLSFRTDNGTRDSEWMLESGGTDSSAIATGGGVQASPFFDIVSQLSPSELIGRFAKTSPKYVQEAVRTTILGLLGSIGKYAFETATVTSAERLANLMFQLQMTGYMFKNAEYRLGLARSLEGVPSLSESADADESAATPTIEGKIRVKISEGMEVEVDADAYMAELRSEVEELRAELARAQSEANGEEAARLAEGEADLLAYVRSMPEEQMRSLTSEVSEDVLDAMKRLVAAVMSGMGASEVSPNTLMQQSGSAMAQLCMWQLVVGYNLREMEVREEMKRLLELDVEDPPPEDGSGGGGGADSSA